jgi:hypothetical protein
MLARHFHTTAVNATQSKEGALAHAQEESGNGNRSLLGSNTSQAQVPSSAPTVIFIAGVEGSGHHFMQKFMNRVVGQHIEFPPAWRCGHRPSSEGIAAMQESMARLETGRTYMLYDICPDCQASYPCGPGSGSNAARHLARNGEHWPRLDWIAQAADGAGVLLHVILLYRTLDDCLASDCLNRNFEDCDGQAETLATAGAALASQASVVSVGPAQMSCFEYGDLDSLAAAMDDIFGDGQVPEDLITSVWEDRAPRGRPRESVQNWADLVGRLGSADNSLRDVCQKSGNATLGTLMQLGRRG